MFLHTYLQLLSVYFWPSFVLFCKTEEVLAGGGGGCVCLCAYVTYHYTITTYSSSPFLLSKIDVFGSIYGDINMRRCVCPSACVYVRV